jgi:anti-sigma B factor antagonist
MVRVEHRISVRVEPSSDGMIVRVAGEIDVATSPVLREALLTAIFDCGGRVSVDMRCVRFIDCCGVGVLAGAARRATRSGRRLVVVSASPSVQRVLELTNLLDVLRIETYPIVAARS